MNESNDKCCDGPCLILHPEGRLGFLRTPYMARWWPRSKRLHFHAQVEAHRDGTWIVALHLDVWRLGLPSLTVSGKGTREVTADLMRL